MIPIIVICIWLNIAHSHHWTTALGLGFPSIHATCHADRFITLFCEKICRIEAAVSTSTVDKIGEFFIQILIAIFDVEVGKMHGVGDVRHAALHACAYIEHFKIWILFVLFDELLCLVYTDGLSWHLILLIGKTIIKGLSYTRLLISPLPTNNFVAYFFYSFYTKYINMLQAHSI